MQAAKLVSGRTRAHRLLRPQASSFASSVGDQFSSNALSFVSDSHPHNDKLVAQVPPPVPKASAEEVSPVLTAKEAVDKQTRKGDMQTPAEKPVSAHACALSVVSPDTRVGAPCLASSIRYPFSSTLHLFAIFIVTCAT